MNNNEQLMINWDNYEEYLILHADGELDEAGEAELQSFIEQNPEVAAELEGFEAVHFEPDMSVTYAGKAALLKPEPVAAPAGRTITLGSWQRYAAAAGIVLAMALGGQWLLTDRGNAENPTPVVVNNPTPATPTAQPQAIPVTNPTTTTIAQPAAPVANPTTPETIAKIDPAPVKTINQPAPAVQPLRTHYTIETIEAVPAYNLDEQSQIALTQKLTVPQPTIVKPYMDSKPEGSFIDKLPIGEDRREGLETLKDNLSEKLAKAKEIRKDLKDTQFALRLGNKELHLF